MMVQILSSLTRFKRFARTAGAFVILAAGLSADPVINILPGGSLTATVVNAVSPPAYVGLDIEGTDIFDVTDGALLIGADGIGSLNPTFPNQVLYAYSFDGTQYVSLTIDDFSLLGDDLFVDVTGTPLTPITDPALAQMENNLTMDFTYESTVVDPTGTYALSSFDLTNLVGTPEPATFFPGLCALGFVLLRLGVSRKIDSGSSAPPLISTALHNTAD